MNSDLSVHELQHIRKLFYGDMNLCGCNQPWEAYALVLRVLDIAPFYDNPEKVNEVIGNAGAAHIVLQVMTDADLLTHGGSIGGSWITPKGEWFRETLRKVNDWEDLDDRFSDIWHDSYAEPLPKDHKCTDDCWAT